MKIKKNKITERKVRIDKFLRNNNSSLSLILVGFKIKGISCEENGYIHPLDLDKKIVRIIVGKVRQYIEVNNHLFALNKKINIQVINNIGFIFNDTFQSIDGEIFNKKKSKWAINLIRMGRKDILKKYSGQIQKDYEEFEFKSILTSERLKKGITIHYKYKIGETYISQDIYKEYFFNSLKDLKEFFKVNCIFPLFMEITFKDNGQKVYIGRSCEHFYIEHDYKNNPYNLLKY